MSGYTNAMIPVLVFDNKERKVMRELASKQPDEHAAVLALLTLQHCPPPPPNTRRP